MELLTRINAVKFHYAQNYVGRIAREAGYLPLKLFTGVLMRVRLFAILAACSLCVVASAQQTLSAAGTYKFVPDPTVVEYNKRKKLEIPRGEIVLRDDYTFALTINDNEGIHRTLGRYSVEKDLVRFTVEEGDGNELPHLMRFSKRGLNGRGAAFTRVMGKLGPSKTPVPTEVVEEGPDVDPAKLFIDQLQGSWTAYRNEKEDRTIRLTVTGSKWKFYGVGVSSGGELELDVDGHCFILVYKLVDGQPLEAGVNMRKRITFAEDGSGFVIEGCQYRKASKP